MRVCAAALEVVFVVGQNCTHFIERTYAQYIRSSWIQAGSNGDGDDGGAATSVAASALVRSGNTDVQWERDETRDKGEEAAAAAAPLVAAEMKIAKASNLLELRLA